MIVYGRHKTATRSTNLRTDATSRFPALKKPFDLGGDLAATPFRLESLNLKVRSKEINFFRRRVCLHNSCRFVAGACEGFAGWDVGLGLGRGARRERAVAPGDRAASRGRRFSFRGRSDGVDGLPRCAR